MFRSWILIYLTVLCLWMQNTKCAQKVVDNINYFKVSNLIKITDRMEKWCLRKAFDNGEYLPDKILWRQKEQFSDGVGYNWIDGLKVHCFDFIANSVTKNNIIDTCCGDCFRSSNEIC